MTCQLRTFGVHHHFWSNEKIAMMQDIGLPENMVITDPPIPSVRHQAILSCALSSLFYIHTLSIPPLTAWLAQRYAVCVAQRWSELAPVQLKSSWLLCPSLPPCSKHIQKWVIDGDSTQLPFGSGSKPCTPGEHQNSS